MDAEGFNAELATAAREMADQPSLGSTLDRAVRMATEILDGCDMAGVSVVRRDGTIETPSATDEHLRRIDELQYELREGPCFRALYDDDSVTCNELDADPRWPRWGTTIAREVGVHASMSLRLFTTRGTLGVLNLYSRTPAAFGHHGLAEAHVLAAHTAVALAAALREDDLLRALETRTTTSQATGMLIERFGIGPEAAVGVLKRVSSHHNIKMYEVAKHLVETRHLVGTSGPDVGECPTSERA